MRETGGPSSERTGGGMRHGPWMWTAYRAYNDLLREKVKRRFEEQEGPWMDRVAELLVKIVNARWEGGRKGSKELEGLFGQLDALLSE